MTFLKITSLMSHGRMIECQKIYILFRFDKIYLFCHGIHRFYGSSLQRCWSDSVSGDFYFVFCFDKKYISVVTEHIISMAVQCSDVDSTLFHIVCCLYSLNGSDSVSEDLYFVFRFDQIYLFCH